MHRLKKGRIEAFMNLFGNITAVELLEGRIAELEAKHDALGRTIRSLELEYIELYDKVRHQMSRMAKRVRVDERTRIEPEVEEVDDDGVDEISRAILARRGGPRTAA